ncbi:MAG: SDR family oxidoreductase [Gammaproteobacteria bacterium]|nr:SDR family oxidoreductase [Gammaproteobacteria bacterium]
MAAATTSRSVCIVGAGGGIGQATARRFMADGYRVIVMDRPGPAMDAIAKECGTHATGLDLRDPASVRAAFETARQTTAEIDALICLSGIVDNGKLATLTLERWNEVLAINLTGTFLCCHAAQTWVRDGGRIVLTGSLSGRTGGVITGAAYAAAKAGIEGLTKSMAQEFAPRGITVNCIAPGIIDTPMLDVHPADRKAAMSATVPLKRMGRPEEVAATIAFLASEGAAYITGEVVAVNGGFRMD